MLGYLYPGTRRARTHVPDHAEHSIQPAPSTRPWRHARTCPGHARPPGPTPTLPRFPSTEQHTLHAANTCMHSRLASSRMHTYMCAHTRDAPWPQPAAYSANMYSGAYGGPPAPLGGRPVHAGCPWCGPAAPQPPTPVVATAQDQPAAADQQGRGRRLLSAE